MKSHPNRVAFFCNFFIIPSLSDVNAGANCSGCLRLHKTMRDFAVQFYKSKQWKKTRELYISSVGGLCEICERNGKIVPGEIVHHKTPLSPENINDLDITLNFKNLCLVCRDCHSKIHSGSQRRYEIDELGRVIL